MQGARRGCAARTRPSPGEGETITDDLPPIARAELALRGWLMRRRRPVVLALSVVLHGLIVLPMILAPSEPIEPEPPPMVVQLVEIPKPIPVLSPPAPDPEPSPAPAAAPVETPKPTPAKPPPKRRPTPRPPPPEVETVPASRVEVASVGSGVELTDAQIAGAARAGSGSGSGDGAGGGECDMLRWLQAKLRQDRRVQAAMATAHRGRPVMVWNGDWVVHPGQEGGGLAAVREIMTWEIAYAPEACRAERVRGLVLISLRDGAGGAHIALGDGDWTWSDLIHARSAVTHGKTLRR